MASARPLRVEIVPVGLSPAALGQAGRDALQHPAVRDELGDGEHRVLSVVPFAVGDGGEADHVRATVYDYANERALVVEAPVDGSPHVRITSSVRQPLPSAEEFAAALLSLERDDEIGPALRDGRVVAYRPMPPIVVDELPDGRLQRTIAVGLRPTEADGEHEIVGVKAASGEVRRFDGGAPASALAVLRRCGLPNAGQATASRGQAGAASVTISRGGEVLWTFIAVRPAASLGTNGSAIELREVFYKAKRVFRRAHVPILNVRYDADACGPFRDWQWQESMIAATGSDPAPGFRLCPQPANTILESGSDQGNFLGVAVYVQGEEVVLVSELEAGWYRYVSQWRLDANGTIRPRFGFGAVENSCVCNVHHHHVYWRFDFDVVTPSHNTVEEFNDPPLAGQTGSWHPLQNEIKRPKNPGRKRKWRVVNTTTGERYTLTPGPSDGVRDSFGVGDLWALRARNNQIDDGQDFTTDPNLARANIDRFNNGEPIADSNVVLWYAAHFTHDISAEESVGHGHIVGPDLQPGGW